MEFHFIVKPTKTIIILNWWFKHFEDISFYCNDNCWNLWEGKCVGNEFKVLSFEENYTWQLNFSSSLEKDQKQVLSWKLN